MRALFARSDHPYAGADMAAARHVGALLWVIGAAIVVMLLPSAPPTVALGDAGWIVAALIVALCLAGAQRLRSAGDSLSYNELLATSYLALGQIALLEWLAGGQGSPYQQLYLLSMMYTCCIHPPRRVAPYLLAATVAVFAPLLYDGFSGAFAARSATQLLIWYGLGLAGLVLMAGVRAQRLGLQREGEDARRLARVDSLTGLGNRRAFDEALAAEVARAERSGNRLAILVADLDGFKEINDRYGHLSGDRCLKEVAGAIRAAVREPDSCFRWGGDEFAVLLPGSEDGGAALVGQRLVEAAAGCTSPDGRPLTLAFGTALLDERVAPDALVAAADAALIAAKERGQPAPRLERAG